MNKCKLYQSCSGSGLKSHALCAPITVGEIVCCHFRKIGTVWRLVNSPSEGVHCRSVRCAISEHDFETAVGLDGDILPENLAIFGLTARKLNLR
jgi:hypothetical protein